MRYIIIVGCGKTGRSLALELSKTENVVVLDRSIKAMDVLGDDFNGKKIWGDGLDLSVLEEAGLSDADALYLLTNNDNLNLVIGKVAKRKYGTRNVILQVNDIVKKRIFQEEGLTIVNRNYLIVEVLRKCIG
ncbi:MAG: NAD-binding protein [Candidatus Omnitrophica bacterium]|nr:NAD-binding protein [Candidatus Omnitrophota bacterium]